MDVLSLVFLVCCVVTGFWNELITSSEECYRVSVCLIACVCMYVCVCVCVCVCHLETSKVRQPKPEWAVGQQNKKMYGLNTEMYIPSVEFRPIFRRIWAEPDCCVTAQDCAKEGT
jgi:hypothetical protein